MRSKQPVIEVCSSAGCQEILPPPLISSSGSGPRRWRRHYRGLDEATKEIRLIRLKPGDRDKPIQCELLYTPLFKSPSSEDRSAHSNSVEEGTGRAFYWRALSHVWGPPRENETRPFPIPIFIGDDEIHLRHNLSECLFSLRDHKCFEPIWIDALCINQADHTERASQVRMMNDVYSAAGEVLIYLCFRFGKFYRDLEKENLAQLSAQLLATTLGDKEGISKAVTEWSIGAQDSQLLDYVATILDENNESYWSRLWTLQECAFARSITVISGPFQTSWQNLLGLAQIAEDTRVDIRTERSPYGVPLEAETGDNHLKKIDRLICSSLIEREKLRTQTPESDLLTFLWNHCLSLKCTDARDSIYGLTGLAGPSQNIVNLDYTICASCVWRKATESVIAKTGRLDVLTASGTRNNKATLKNPKLSWVPHWAYMRVLPPSWHYRFSPTTLADYKLSSHGTALVAQGFFLGSIMGPQCHLLAKNIPLWGGNMHFISELSAFISANVKNRAYRRMCLEDLGTIFMESIEDDWLSASTVQRVCTTTTNLLAQSCWPDEEEDVAHIYTNLNTLLGGQQLVLVQLTSSLSASRPRLGISDTAHMRQGDIICGILGCNLPLIIRSCEGGYHVLGTCLLPGYGHGQAIEELRSEKRPLDAFSFV